MGIVFKALGAIQLLIVGVAGAGKVLSTLWESGFLDAIVMLFLVTIAFFLSMPLYLLGGLMDDVEALQRQISELKKANKETDKKEQKNNQLYAGGWKCSCGHVNDNYASTCTCGKDKYYVVEKAYEQTPRAVEPDQSAQAAPEAREKPEQVVFNADGWKCICGRVNADYKPTCTCGRGRYAEDKAYAQMMSDLKAMRGDKPPVSKRKAAKTWEEEIISAGGWKCSCGQVNYGYVSTCACGKGKNEMDM